MTSLSTLVDSGLTDKNTQHSYLDLYEELLGHKRNTATCIIEVGIGCFFDKNGGSLKLWKDYFTYELIAIHGIDILPKERVIEDLIDHPNVVLHCSSDAYNFDFINDTFYSKNIKADFILDDGAHTLESMKIFLSLYLPLLKQDGILIIEDVQDISWIDILKGYVPGDLKEFIKVYDLRHVKNRYDDIVFVVDRSNSHVDKQYNQI